MYGIIHSSDKGLEYSLDGHHELVLITNVTCEGSKESVHAQSHQKEKYETGHEVSVLIANNKFEPRYAKKTDCFT